MVKKLKNNKAGQNAPIRLFSFMILFVLLTFVIDIIVMITNMTLISYNGMYYAKKLAAQGGLIGSGSSIISCRSGSQIVMISGGGRVTNSQIAIDFEEKMKKMGVEDFTVTVYDDGEHGEMVTVLVQNGVRQAGSASAASRNKQCFIDPNDPLTAAYGFGTIGSFEVKWVYDWHFCPIMTIPDIQSNFTNNFEWRSEYIRNEV